MSVALVGRPNFHALIGGEMFKVPLVSMKTWFSSLLLVQVALHAALSAFGSGSMVKEKENADPSLIREVYIALGAICPYPRQLFLGLPGKRGGRGSVVRETISGCREYATAGSTAGGSTHTRDLCQSPKGALSPTE